MIHTRAQLQALTKEALRAATADDLRIRVTSESEGYLRLSQNQAAASGEVTRAEIAITATIGGRTATARGNALDRPGLAALVAEAEALARLAPVDPEWMPSLGPQRYLEVDADDRETAAIDGGKRLDLGKAMLRVANRGRLEASGMILHRRRAVALATRAGLFAHHPETEVELSMTCRTRDGTGSGWASAIDHRLSRIDPEALATRAAEKAGLSQGPESIAPGSYTVLLEPQAVGELLLFLDSALDRRSADEGRSAFSRPGGGVAVGEALFHPSITLRSAPADREHPSAPFADDGQPLAPVTWIDRGVLKTLRCGRYWAKKSVIEPFPPPASYHLGGGGATEESLLRGLDEGIVVTRFWYNRMLRPQSVVVTGLTRDGTFLVKGGTITRSLKNLRYNESPLNMLKNAIALGEPRRVAVGGRVVVVPAMVVSGFRFSSVSDAV